MIEKNRAVSTREGIAIKHNLKPICRTFDSYFFDKNPESVELLKNKEVLVKEYSMVPNKWLTQLYEVHEKYGISITMVGDDNQCSPVEGGSTIHYNYTNSA